MYIYNELRLENIGMLMSGSNYIILENNLRLEKKNTIKLKFILKIYVHSMHSNIKIHIPMISATKEILYCPK